MHPDAWAEPPLQLCEFAINGATNRYGYTVATYSPDDAQGPTSNRAKSLI